MDLLIILDSDRYFVSILVLEGAYISRTDRNSFAI
jgi:hypothetical protein